MLAREVQVHAPADHDPAAVLGVLRDAFPSCLLVCAGRGDARVRRGQPRAADPPRRRARRTLALAGSTRRSADPAVDDHLGERLLRSTKDREEQAIVARRIARTLRPHSVWVTAPEEPVLVKMANIQHLAHADPRAARAPIERDRAGGTAASRRPRSAASRSPSPRR